MSRIKIPSRYSVEPIPWTIICLMCLGKQRLSEKDCEDCNGTGRVPVKVISWTAYQQAG